MKYLCSVTSAMLLLGVFALPSVAVAQDTNNPYQQPNQYQPPADQPPAQVQQSEPQGTPSEPAATPPEQSTLYQGTPAPVQPAPQAQQETTPAAPLPAPTPGLATTNQSSSSPAGYYVLYVAIIMLALFWFGWWRKLLKRKKTIDLPAEDDGSVCKTCGGKGTITKNRAITAPCNHCKQTGIDICHHCGGSGRYNGGFTVPQTQEEVESLMKCDYCGGKGFPKIALPCCMCKGKKKEEAQESYEATCPTCKGTGRVPK